jgi:hypothetical protein
VTGLSAGKTVCNPHGMQDASCYLRAARRIVFTLPDARRYTLLK